MRRTEKEGKFKKYSTSSRPYPKTHPKIKAPQPDITSPQSSSDMIHGIIGGGTHI
jgi:hypothetical protein